MHILHQLFGATYRLRELIALRDTLGNLLRVLLAFVVGRIVIDVAARRVAETVVAGPRRLGITESAALAARVHTIVGLVRSIGVYVLFFVCAILALRALNFDAVSVVTSASIAGIAVGLGAQKLFRDVIAGFFIILENQYVVGETIVINAVTAGRVEEMGMRVVKLRDDTGRLIIFANGDITQVTNQSRGPIGGTVEIGVPPGTELARVRQIVDDASRALEQEEPELGLDGAPALLGVSGGDATRTVLRVALRVTDGSRLGEATIRLRNALYTALLAAGLTPS